MKTVPNWAIYWTADEMAECLPYFPDDPEKRDRLYATLRDILIRCKNKTPTGGDGADGTVEHPDGRRDLKNDDKPGHWWHMLADAEAAELTAAYQREQHAN